MQVRTRPAISTATPDTVQATDVVYVVRPGATIEEDADYHSLIGELVGSLKIPLSSGTSDPDAAYFEINLSDPYFDVFNQQMDGSLFQAFFCDKYLFIGWYNSAGTANRELSAKADSNEAEFKLTELFDSNLVGEFRATPIKIYLKDAAGVERFSATNAGVADGTEYRVNGTKVVGARGTAISNPTEVVADGVIGALPISAAYSQAEVQALRDQVETLRDALASTQAQFELALAALRTHGLIAT